MAVASGPAGLVLSGLVFAMGYCVSHTQKYQPYVLPFPVTVTYTCPVSQLLCQWHRTSPTTS